MSAASSRLRFVSLRRLGIPSKGLKQLNNSISINTASPLRKHQTLLQPATITQTRPTNLSGIVTVTLTEARVTMPHRLPNQLTINHNTLSRLSKTIVQPQPLRTPT